MIFTGSQWLTAYEMTDYDKVDAAAVTLALMFDADPRLTDCDDELYGIIDSMAPDTVLAHAVEFHAADYA